MQKFSQKYTIICLLEEIMEGHEFSSTNWPLHITLADTFSISKSSKDLIRLIVKLAKKFSPINIESTNNEFFGPNQDIKVTVYENNEYITKLHFEILDALQYLGVVFNDPQYTREGYKPHSTVQKHNEIKVGTKELISNLAIVDMFHNKDSNQRKILKKVILK